jgi:DNA-binding response OmpR family regulator
MDILIIDDDPYALKLASFVLEEAGYTAHRAASKSTALQILQRVQVELVLLDVGLPEISGFDLYRDIRACADVPVIFVTARAGIDERVHGLKLGADDYIVKPFEPAELVARIGAVLRRRAPDPLTPIAQLSHGGITLDPVRQQVSFSDNSTSGLTPIEFRLLYYLIENAGRVLTTDQILNKVWGYDDGSGRNLVAVYIRRLRTKMEAAAQQSRYIKTIANTGYKFDL